MRELKASGKLETTLRAAGRVPSAHPTPPVSGRGNLLNDVWQDLRYGVRLLTRDRGFTAAAVLTLALGIGATTAIFSVVNAVLLKPVPFADHERLAMLWETDRNTGTVREPASFPDYVDLKQRSRQFQELATFVPTEASVASDDAEPVRLAALFVTYDLLPMLGIAPVHGRHFTREEDVPGGPRVALISERLWQRLFNRSAEVIGRTIRLNEGNPRTIVGVLPDDADFGTMQILRRAAYGRGFADRDVRSRVDVWIPVQGDASALSRDTHPFLVVGRLASGATVSTAQQEAAATMSDLEAAYPSNAARGAFVEAIPDVVFSGVRGPLWILLAAVGFVLLIACVNVANLLLARGAARMREVAVRTAMGAMIHRLGRQFAAENLVLTITAAALGILLAAAALGILKAVAPADVPRLASVSVDVRVLAATLITAVATGLVFGLVPVAQARRLDVHSALRVDESRGSTASRQRGLLRSTLVVLEISLAVVLLVGAGLLIRSFWHLSTVDAGFSASGVLKSEFQLPATRYPANGAAWPDFVEVHRFNDQLLTRVAALPGVESAAIVGNHPVDPGFQNSWRVVGREAEGANWPEISVRRVSPGYFATVSLAVASGRPFADSDGPAAAPVTMINETTARRFFDGREPIGQQISLWGANRTIVGIVRDERIHGLAVAAPPALYLPFAQAPSFNGAEALLVRASSDVSLASSVRAAIREIDPRLAVFGVEPLSATLAGSVAQQRFVMLLLIVFAGVAVALAAIGIHGVISYTIARRRHEIGIRIALGASPAAVLRMVLSQGAALTAIGLAVGLGGAMALTRVLNSLLTGVSTTDTATFIAVLPFLGSVAMLATWLPARRAVRTDPVAAMRDE
jgi:predicted permease